jgi:hypothetical protein
MKSYFTRSSILIITALLSVATLSGQKNQVPGSIVNNSGIKLDGTIVYQSENELFQTCQLKAGNGAESKNYLPSTIKSYEFLNRKFVSFYNPVLENRCFMEQLASGKLNLYFCNIGSVHFFVNKLSDSTLHPLPYFRDNRYVDNGYTKRLKWVESTFHIDTLKMLMKERTDLYIEIENISSPEKAPLLSLIQKFNAGTVVSSTNTNPNPMKPTLLMQGKISLYVWHQKEQEDRFFIRKNPDRKMIELPFSRLKNQQAGGIKIVDYGTITSNHKDSLKKYMADAPPLKPMIENIFVPNAKNLGQLVEEYNSYTDSISFVKKHRLKRLPINLDIVPGIYMVFVNPNYPLSRLGMFVHSGFFNSNQHFFLKSGLFLYKGDDPVNDIYGTKSDITYKKPKMIVKVPAMIEYRMSEGNVQPLIAVGYNYYRFTVDNPDTQALMPAICPGLNISMGKRFSVRLNAEIEFNNNKLTSWTPEKLKRAGLFAGLQIKL